MKSNSSVNASATSAHDMAQAKEPTSPCNLVCELDPAGQFCRGCYRTLAEIAAWSQYSAAQKKSVLQALSARQQQRLDAQLTPPSARIG